MEVYPITDLMCGACCWQRDGVTYGICRVVRAFSSDIAVLWLVPEFESRLQSQKQQITTKIETEAVSTEISPSSEIGVQGWHHIEIH